MHRGLIGCRLQQRHLARSGFVGNLTVVLPPQATPESRRTLSCTQRAVTVTEIQLKEIAAQSAGCRGSEQAQIAVGSATTRVQTDARRPQPSQAPLQTAYPGLPARTLMTGAVLRRRAAENPAKRNRHARRITVVVAVGH